MNASELKELLLLAAKAMGLETDAEGTPFKRVMDEQYGPCCEDWNPLTPGDGAEMEDKLRISVVRSPTSIVAGVLLDPPSHCELYADHPTEGHARRWASLRVAAEIGRSMK